MGRPTWLDPCVLPARRHVLAILALAGAVLADLGNEPDVYQANATGRMPTGSMCFVDEDEFYEFETGEGEGERVDVADCAGSCCASRICQSKSTCQNLNILTNLFFVAGFGSCVCCCCACCYVFNMSLPLGATVIVVGASDGYENLNGAYCPRGEKHNGHEMLINESDNRAQIFWQDECWNMRLGAEPPLVGCCSLVGRGTKAPSISGVLFQPTQGAIEECRNKVGEKAWKKYKGVPFGDWQHVQTSNLRCSVLELEAYTVSGAGKGLKSLNGVYHRVGHHKKRPKYRHDHFNSSIYWEGRWILFTEGPVKFDLNGNISTPSRSSISDRCCYHFVGDGSAAATSADLPPEGVWVKHGECQTTPAQSVKVSKHRVSDTRLHQAARRSLSGGKLTAGAPAVGAGTKVAPAIFGSAATSGSAKTADSLSSATTAATNKTTKTLKSGLSRSFTKNMGRTKSVLAGTPLDVKFGIAHLNADEIMSAYLPDASLEEGAALPVDAADEMPAAWSPLPSDSMVPIIPDTARPDMFCK